MTIPPILCHVCGQRLGDERHDDHEVYCDFDAACTCDLPACPTCCLSCGEHEDPHSELCS